MNLRISNQLNMVGASITLAVQPEYELVWNGKEPVAFTADFALVRAAHGDILAKAALAEAATGGAADAKATAETVLEDEVFKLARALANYFKRIGDLDRLGKVDVSKSAIVKLRTQDLVNKATAIRDVGNVAMAETGASERGVTAARVATVSGAILAYSKLMNSPRGQMVNRNALLKEIETDAAELVEATGDLDDLVMQFDGTEEGRRFIEAWKRARIIVDVGGGRSSSDTPPEPTPAPTPPK